MYGTLDEICRKICQKRVCEREIERESERERGLTISVCEVLLGSSEV